MIPLKKINETVIIPDAWMLAVDDFVNKMAERGDCYGNRGQTNPRTKRDQQALGKRVEIATYILFDRRGTPCAPPDLKVYPVHQKSWSPDLVLRRHPTHVKSCDIDSIYPKSWVFEKTDKEIFRTPNQKHVIVMGTASKNSNIVTLDWIGEKNYLLDFMEPLKLLRLTSKLALYDKTLEGLI